MPGRSAVCSSSARKSRQPLLQRPRILRRIAVQPPAPAPATVPAITNVVLSAEERAAEIDRLQDWSMNDDAESLNHIVADLTSPEKEIREAALEATKQFGSPPMPFRL
jgi:hypothetical protein